VRSFSLWCRKRGRWQWVSAAFGAGSVGGGSAFLQPLVQEAWEMAALSYGLWCWEHGKWQCGSAAFCAGTEGGGSACERVWSEPVLHLPDMMKGWASSAGRRCRVPSCNPKGPKLKSCMPASRTTRTDTRVLVGGKVSCKHTHACGCLWGACKARCKCSHARQPASACMRRLHQARARMCAALHRADQSRQATTPVGCGHRVLPARQ